MDALPWPVCTAAARYVWNLWQISVYLLMRLSAQGRASTGAEPWPACRIVAASAEYAANAGFAAARRFGVVRAGAEPGSLCRIVALGAAYVEYEVFGALVRIS